MHRQDIFEWSRQKGYRSLVFSEETHAIDSFCSCCQCCCHDLQFLKKYGRNDLIARSEYIASTEAEHCIHCGVCADRCVFAARLFQDDQMMFDAGLCYGCGLCVTVCPENAIIMQKRSEVGIIA